MSFSEDANSFSLSAVPLKSIDDIGTGLWLVLVGVNETPPHIALISDGKYYSLSARKVDCGGSLKRFISVIERKQIPTLFLRIETKNNAISPILEDIYKDLSPLGNTDTTCLLPIKVFFCANYSEEFISVNYVFELLALADKKNLLSENISLFCEYANSNNITLPKYTLTEIRNKIQELSARTNSLNNISHASI